MQIRTNQVSCLCERPVLGNANEGQALLQAQSPLGPLHYVHKVDVAITNLLNLQCKQRTTSRAQLEWLTTHANVYKAIMPKITRAQTQPQSCLGPLPVLKDGHVIIAKL